ncbi:hypothetical protein [Streptomyces sp. CB00316]|uniref:hypothetical protein n=1 Tax=Streptomyces sp. CB00316 TaxID=1703932 RepID=UPI0018FEC70C|nr:hypothetical protein [Streptomyces sp. CB00316]
MGDAIGQLLGVRAGHRNQSAATHRPHPGTAWPRQWQQAWPRRPARHCACRPALALGVAAVTVASLLGGHPILLAVVLLLFVAAVTTAAPAIAEPVTLTFEAVVKGCGES